MSNYREPDLTARVAELEDEVENLKRGVLKARRREAWAKFWDWFVPVGFVGCVCVVSVGLVAYGIYLADRLTTSPVVLPDGRHGFVVTCRDWEDCEVEKGRACPGGYEVRGQASAEPRRATTIACKELR